MLDEGSSTFLESGKVLISITWSYCRLYFFWIMIHYTSSHAYIYFCTPLNWVGFLKSPFLILSPQCQTIDWIQINSRHIIKNTWMTVSMWASTTLFKYFTPS